MIVDLGGVGVRRPTAGIDFSDLTDCEVIGPFTWLGDGVLEIPFDREPTADEQAAIRRRLVTRDQAEETRVSEMRATVIALAKNTTPVARGIRLLLEERLSQLKETP